jgi:lipoprotein-anchoring transpeptidase ErfK/SrfK
LQNNAVLRDRGLVLRIKISSVVIAFALAGFRGEAMAQAYPPLLPGDYYQTPPGPYPAPVPRPYTNAPVPPLNVGAANESPSDPYRQAPYVYRDANGFLVQPFDQGYDEPAYSPASRPYFGTPDRAALPAPPSLGGGQFPRPPADVGGGVAPAPYGTMIAALPPDDQPESGPARELPPQLRRQLVDYVTSQPAGTVIIDTPHTYLYLVLGAGNALRYGIGVGREGFTWNGTERISRMSEWPDWHPPSEMIDRQPYLPRFMAGGPGNPLGARALYLGKTLYRIHGTNQPSTIGTFVSSGCIRLINEDVEDLYSRVQVGTRVVVMPGRPGENVANGAPQSAANGPGPVTAGAPMNTAPPSTASVPRSYGNGITSSPLPPPGR